jgi:hypothetical protein
MGVDIRVLIPAGEDELGRIMNELNLSALPHKIHIRSIDESANKYWNLSG